MPALHRESRLYRFLLPSVVGRRARASYGEVQTGQTQERKSSSSARRRAPCLILLFSAMVLVGVVMFLVLKYANG